MALQSSVISVYDTISQGDGFLVEVPENAWIQNRYFPSSPRTEFFSKKIVLDFDSEDLKAGAWVKKGFVNGDTTKYRATAIEPPRIGVSDTVDPEDDDRQLFEQICYEMGDNDANKSDMKRWQAQAEVSFLFRVADNFYIGPMASYDYVIGKHIERPELLQGMDQHTWNVGAGVSLVYDNRDNLTNPHRGIFLNINQMFRPGFMGNDYAFSTTAFRFDVYQRLGKGTVLAEDIRANLNFGNPSWGMMAELGGTHSMRGYYEGRYRDKHSLEATVELRQHVWKRNGIVVWVGAGTIFPKFSALRSKQILPNAGVGYRWEFKKNVNVRLDYGFGKSGQSGFLFNINEAF